MSENEIQSDQPETTGPQPSEQVAPQPDSQSADTPSRREAKYRTELRAEQARNDALAKQVAALQRAEVNRLASSRLIDPADALRELDVNDVLTEDGAVDPERVGAVVDAVVAARPHYAAPQPGMPGAAPASAFTGTLQGGVGIGAIGGLGGEPLSINRQQVQPQEDWATVLRDAAGG